MVDYNEHQLVDEVRAKLVSKGKSHFSVTRTDLWYYGIDRKFLDGLKDILKVDVEKRKFVDSIVALFTGDKSQDSRRTIENFYRRGKFESGYTFDCSGDKDLSFDRTPPVRSCGRSERILVVGTKGEAEAIMVHIKNLTGRGDDVPRACHYKNEGLILNGNLLSRLKSTDARRIEDIPLIKGTEEKDFEKYFYERREFNVKEAKSNITYCNYLESFWQAFFDKRNFLDEPVTLPREIASTGYIGSRDILLIDDRLKQISERFRIKLTPIEQPFKSA